MKKRLKINGIIIFLAFFLIVLFPKLFFRPKISIQSNTVLEVFGFAFILLGQLFRVSGRGFKVENSGQGHFLIKRGPYSLVRNPMYLGILLIGLGIVLTLFKWWAVLIFLVIFALRYILLIFQEEKKLKDTFPIEYENYQRQTPRLMPSVKAVYKRFIFDYLPLKLGWIEKEAGSIIAVLLATVGIGAWRDIANYGLRVYIKTVIALLTTFILFICLVFYLDRKTDGSVKSQINK
jgi:protein-S-isoprenylcysteine O-methyltransferase Ste14